MFRKTLLLVFALLLIPPALCAQSRTEETRINIMVLSGTTGLSLVKMLEEHPSLGGNVTVDYTVVKAPDQMVAKVISGEADIAALPTSTASILYNKGIPIKLGAITNWGVMYLLGREQTVKDWKELKGKEVAGIAKGTSPDLLFRYLLSANGLDPDQDLALRYYPTPVELAQMAIAGRVDLAFLPEPWVTEVITKNSSYRILLDFQEEWKKVEHRRESYPQSCIVIQKKLIQERPEIVVRFLAEAASSSRWVNEQPEAAGLLAQKHIFISAAAAQAAIPRCNLRFAVADDIRQEVDYYLRKFYEFNPQSIGEKVPDENFYLRPL